jgi:glycosyltransferase involved in cell wall biosynthesis
MRAKKLSIIIPAYNEEKTLPAVLKKISSTRFPIKTEIIMIDDASKDGTLQVLRKSKIKDLKVLSHKKNKGKGAAIKTGIKKATGDIIAIQDADLEYDLNEINRLILPIMKGEERVVYGSRFLGKGKQGKLTFYLGNRFLSFFTSLLYFRKITDMETCQKVFSKEIIKSVKIESDRFDFEPEITSKILRQGIRIKELPISYNPRTAQQGKKIKVRDGFVALYKLLKYRFQKYENHSSAQR